MDKLLRNLDLEGAFIDLVETIPQELKKIDGILELDSNILAKEYFKSEGVVDMSIDPNANINGKSPVNFNSEIFKPLLKIRSYYLLWKNIKKDWGIAEANKVIGDIFLGKLYYHDICKIDLPYTYSPKETVTIKTYRGVENLALEELYDIYSGKYQSIKQNEEAKTVYPKGVKILDGDKWVDTEAITKKRATRNMVLLRFSNGLSQMVTDNHPIITNKGEKDAIDVEKGDIVSSYKPKFNSSKNTINLAEELIINNCYDGFKLDGISLKSIVPEYFNDRDIVNGAELSWDGNTNKTLPNKFNLTEGFGYITGLFIAEGSFHKNGIALRQSKEKIVTKYKSALSSCGFNWSKVEDDKYLVCNKGLATIFKDVFRLGEVSQEKSLPKNYLSYNNEFLKGLLAGVIDGDGSVYEDKQSGCIRLTSRTLLIQLQDVFYKLGLRTRISKVEGIGSKREFNGRVIEQKLPLHRLGFSITVEDIDIDIPAVTLMNKRKLSTKNSLKKKLDSIEGEVTVVDKEVLSSESVPGGFIYDVTTETGTLRCNNIHSHNCFAPDTTHLMVEGRPYGWLPSTPPNKMRSFMGQLREMTMDYSQENAGAIGIANALVNLSYYTKQEREQRYKAVEELSYNSNMGVLELANFITRLFSNSDEKFEKNWAEVEEIAKKGTLPSVLYKVSDYLLDKEIEDELQQTVHIFHNTFRTGGDSLRYDTSILIQDNQLNTERYMPIGKFCDEEGIGTLDTDRFKALSFNTVTGKSEFKRVTATIRHENPSKFMRVKLSTGQEIIVTDSHSLFIMNKNGEVQVMAPKNNPENIMVPIGNLLGKEIEYYIPDTGGRKDITREIKLTPSFARFLGYYVAEGNVDGSTIQLSLFNKEMESYTKGALLESLEEVSFRTEDGSLLCNVGKDFALFIGGLCGQGAENKRIPDQILNASKKVISSFISGYLEGDGYVGKNRITVSSVSQDLLRGVHLLLLKLGVIATIHSKVKEEGEKYMAPNDKYAKERCSWRMNISGRYKDEFNFIHHDKEEKRQKLNVVSPRNYLDTDFLRPLIKEVYRDYIALKSDGAKEISYDIIQDTLEDLDERIKGIKGIIKENIDYTTAKELASICTIPENCGEHYQEQWDWPCYSLRYKQSYINSRDNFIEVVKERLEKMEDLKKKLEIFNNAVPIKVDNIEYLKEEEYSYDLSVDGNENFLAGDNIYAHNSPFTNVSLFDRPTIKKMFEGGAYPDGTCPVDNMDEIMRVQDIYAEFFVKGSPKTGKPYRFPVTTINIQTDEGNKIIDKDFFYKMCDLNRERGVINWYNGAKIAACCRFTPDLSRLKDTISTDSFGNGGLSIGSHRVVTTNLHRIALMAEDNYKRETFDLHSHSKSVMDFILLELEDTLLEAERLLVVHKKILKKRVDSGILKFFNLKWVDLKMFFSTFGFTGLYDAFMVFNEGVFDKKKYIKFGRKVLKFIEEYAEEAGERNEGSAFNVEEIPGEGASPKLAKKDNYLYNTNLELLSNQMVPLYSDVGIYDKLDISGKLMNIVSGGAIFHFNINDELTVGANREIIRRLIEEYNIPHFAINKGFSSCINNHTVVGVETVCPECGGEIETYTSRVVGFFTDTKDWVRARREFDFPNREFYGKEEVEECL